MTLDLDLDFCRDCSSAIIDLSGDYVYTLKLNLNFVNPILVRYLDVAL